jgi:hypothetical protein
MRICWGSHRAFVDVEVAVTGGAPLTSRRFLVRSTFDACGARAREADEARCVAPSSGSHSTSGASCSKTSS